MINKELLKLIGKFIGVTVLVNTLLIGGISHKRTMACKTIDQIPDVNLSEKIDLNMVDEAKVFLDKVTDDMFLSKPEIYNKISNELKTDPASILKKEEVDIIKEKLININKVLDEGGYNGVEEIMATHIIVSKILTYDDDSAERKGNYTTDEETSKMSNDEILDYIIDGSYVDGLINGKAVCEGYAHLMGMILEKRGHNVKYIHGTVYNKPEKIEENISSFHGWLQIEVDGKWYHFNAVYDDDGIEDNLNNYLLSDDDFKKSYMERDKYIGWDEVNYPQASETYPRLELLEDIINIVDNGNLYAKANDLILENLANENKNLDEADI